MQNMRHARWLILSVLIAAATLVAANRPAFTSALAQTPASQPTTKPHIEFRFGGLVLDFQDEPIDTVLAELAEAMGFRLEKDVTLVWSKKVTVVSKQPLKVAEVLLLMNTVIERSGFKLIQDGDVLRVVLVSQ